VAELLANNQDIVFELAGEGGILFKGVSFDGC